MTLKLNRASSILKASPSLCNYRSHNSTPTNVLRSYNSQSHIRSFCGNVTSSEPRQCRPTQTVRLARSASRPVVLASTSAFRSIAARYASNRAETSTLPHSTTPSTTSTADSVQREEHNSLINPPAFTIPPPLDVPKRKPGQFYITYLYSRGRAFLRFFKSGLKNVWTMYRAAQVIKRRQDIAKNSSQSAIPATSNLTDPQPPSISSITRAEFQLLQRNRSALSKVAPFGLFIFVFAEFSPILLLYVTSIVPEQCQLPSVRAKIDRKFNERKYKSFVRYEEHAENTTMGKEDMRLLKAASGGADDRTVSASVISTPSSSASDVKEPTDRRAHV